MKISPDGFVSMLSAYGQQTAFAAKFSSDCEFAQQCVDKLNRCRNVPSYGDVKSFGSQCRRSIKEAGSKAGFVPAKPAKSETWKVSEYIPGSKKSGRKAKTAAAKAAEKEVQIADAAANAAAWKVKFQGVEKENRELREENRKLRVELRKARKVSPAKARKAARKAA